MLLRGPVALETELLTAVHFVGGIRAIRLKVATKVRRDAKAGLDAAKLVWAALAVALVLQIRTIDHAVAHLRMRHALARAATEVTLSANSSRY